ncbi:type I methionyl aminopeptidase [bacterium]|nr:type I methionyl aminopeptidase [bacterium]
MMTQVKTAEEIVNMRESGRMTAHILDLLRRNIQVGMSTQQLDDMVAEELKALGAKAAFLGYQGFPAHICISINEEAVHGLPSPKRIIQDGDVVGLDFGVTYNGMITDSAITVQVGTQDKASQRFLATIEQALSRAIAVVRPGVRVGDIGAAAEQTIESAGYKVILSLTGHGVGHTVHEDPSIPNFGTPGTGMALKEGMTIAIEPIASLTSDDVVLAPDGWTYSSADGSLSGQFEHTVLITRDGAEILTML